MAVTQKTRYSILGLLSWQPMSGYQIKKLVEMGLQHFWSESYGQLYPSLNRLVEEGMAVRTDASDGGRRKRHLYTVTPKGRKAFLAWLKAPTDAPAVRNETQLKFFLTGRRDVQESIRIVEEYRDREQSRHDEYVASEKVLRAAVRKNKPPDELRDLAGPEDDSNQLLVLLLTLRHGVLTTEARLTWCRETLKTLRSRKRSKRPPARST